MSKIVLNDFVYKFEPLKLFEPDPNYKADEESLKRSMQKNQELIAFARDYIKNREKADK